MAESLPTESGMLNEQLQRIQNYYLDLMLSCLTGGIYRDRAQAPFGSNTFDPHLREHGLDWPARAQTMIGVKRMTNLRDLVTSVIADNVPGDFIETGVWRGGACIFLRAILFAHNITNRSVWAADSFAGLPTANDLQYPADAGSDFHTYPQLAVSLEQVKENFRAYGLLDQQTKFLKGWFKDTLPTAPVEQFALIRLDGDMYESTMDALTHLYPKLSDGGYVIIDDYHVVPACKAAVHDYCKAKEVQPDIIEIDGVGVYWRKSGAPMSQPGGADQNQTSMSTEAQIARLNAALVELGRNVIAVLDQSLVERDQSLVERDQLLAERTGEMEKLKHSLNALQSSISWRVTKPIRAIQKIVKGDR